MRRMWAWVMVVMGIAIAHGGCGKSEAPPPAPEAAGTIPTKYVEAAKTLEAAIRKQDADAIEAMVDAVGFTEDVMRGVPLDDKFRANIRRDPLRFIGVTYVRLGKMTRETKFLHVHRNGREVRATFRLQNSDGLNYHEWVLVENAQGQVRGRDVWVASAADFLSQSIRRRVLLPMATQLNKGDTAAAQRVLTETTQREKRIREAMEKGDNAALLAAYDALPPNMKATKENMVLRMTAAGLLRKTKPEVWQEAVADFRRAFPHDPAADLMLLPVLLEENDYAGYMQSLDRLQTAIGGDPYLGTLRGDALLLEGKPESLPEVIKLAREALVAEPDLERGYNILLRAQVKGKDFAAAVEKLREQERITGLVYNELEKAPEMEAFVTSTPYRQWRQERHGNKEPEQQEKVEGGWRRGPTM